MPRVPANRIYHSHGTINPTRNGTFLAFLLDKATGTRHRATLKTLSAARAWLEMTADATGASRRPLSAVQLADATAAYAALPAGYTLTDAARALNARPADDSPPLTLADAKARFLEARSGMIKPVTLKGYRLAVSALQGIVDGLLADVAPQHIEALLAGLHPTTRNSRLRDLSAFFRWCQSRGLVKVAATDGVERARAVEPSKGVLTPSDAEKVLRQAEKDDPRLVPYLAIGMFAGIRPAELGRLVPGKIGRHYITLDGAITKAASQRTVKIQPNLRAWLRAYPHADPVAPLSERNRFRAINKLVTAAGIVWPPDCMRHSWMSYYYELTADAALVSAEGGHSGGTGVFFRHYRALVKPGDGKRWFAIRPGKA